MADAPVDAFQISKVFANDRLQAGLPPEAGDDVRTLAAGANGSLDFSLERVVDRLRRHSSIIRIVPPTRELSAADWLQQSFDIYNQMAEISRQKLEATFLEHRRRRGVDPTDFAVSLCT